MNPAVSTSLFLRECRRNYKANFMTYLMYVGAQLLGAMLGVMVGFVGIGTEIHPKVKSISNAVIQDVPFIAYLCPANGCNETGYYFQVVLVECLMTFFFAGTVTAVAKWDSARDGPENCIVIGTSLGIGI